MKVPILWVVNPRFGNMVKYLRKSLVCYHVVDNYSEAPYWSEQTRASIARAEKQMLSIADVVFVTSPFLLEKQSKYNKNVYLVRNAVDYERFAPSHHFENIPEDIVPISRPIIGYIGILNDKLDYDLIKTVARARPNWSFVFVGRNLSKSGSEVYKFVHDHPSNIFLLGQRNVEEVPRYIHAFDICILPYLCDEYTEAIDSLKRYEYFASEKPIVSTDVPTAREYSQVIYIAKDANGFIHKLDEAMMSTDSKRSAIQRSIALQNTWDKRVVQLSLLIQTLLQKKSVREN